MKKTVSILYLAICFFLPVSGQCQTTIMVDSEKQFDLAQTLYDQKEFNAAANEFIRFFYLFPDHDKVEQARYKAAVSYYYAGQYQDAQRHLEKIAGLYADSDFALKAMFKLSELYMVKSRPGKAVSTLKNLIRLTRDQNQIHDRACFMLGWLLLDNEETLKAGSDYRIYPIKEARKYFSMISVQGKQKYNIKPILDALIKIDQVKQKKPVLSGIFSIIPGAGFLYCERYKDAAVAFLLNTSLMLAAYTSFENDNPALGGVITFVESGFYTANIYGAISSAHKYNKNKKQKYIQKLKKQSSNRFSLQPGLTKNGIALMFQYEF